MFVETQRLDDRHVRYHRRCFNASMAGAVLLLVCAALPFRGYALIVAGDVGWVVWLGGMAAFFLFQPAALKGIFDDKIPWHNPWGSILSGLGGGARRLHAVILLASLLAVPSALRFIHAVRR